MTRKMTEEQRARRRDYQRKYYYSHRDEYLERGRKLRVEHADEWREYHREYNRMHPEISRRSSTRYRMVHPDRAAESVREWDARRRAKLEAEYRSRLQKLDGRILFIGCSLDTDSDARKIIGRRVVLKGGDNETIWQSKTYGMKCSWLQMLCHSYRQFRKLRGVKQPEDDK